MYIKSGVKLVNECFEKKICYLVQFIALMFATIYHKNLTVYSHFLSNASISNCNFKAIIVSAFVSFYIKQQMGIWVIPVVTNFL